MVVTSPAGADWQCDRDQVEGNAHSIYRGERRSAPAVQKDGRTSSLRYAPVRGCRVEQRCKGRGGGVGADGASFPRVGGGRQCEARVKGDEGRRVDGAGRQAGGKRNGWHAAGIEKQKQKRARRSGDLAERRWLLCWWTPSECRRASLAETPPSSVKKRAGDQGADAAGHDWLRSLMSCTNRSTRPGLVLLAFSRLISPVVRGRVSRSA